MNKSDLKRAIISIAVAAAAAFFASLADGLLHFLQNNGPEIASGALAGAIYTLKGLRT